MNRLVPVFLTITISLAAVAQQKPNILLINFDDMGYADLGCYEPSVTYTPRIDEIARQGVRFTDFYASQPVCSASRASLMTGAYANRVGIHHALGPRNPIGLNPHEQTLAELVKTAGYRTSMVGKWHLGDQPAFLPKNQGFDFFEGVPYSHDMWPNHPNPAQGKQYGELFWLHNNGEKTRVESADSVMAWTNREVDRELSRLSGRGHQQPFFLYVAHPLPHVPLGLDRQPTPANKSVYGQVIGRLDEAVGHWIDLLGKNGQLENTLIILTSDNGPWLQYGNHAGSAGRFREGKGTTWEGGVRVPAIFYWKGKIPAGKLVQGAAMNIDILPTISSLLSAKQENSLIDGKNIWPFISGEKIPDDLATRPLFFYYETNQLQAVRWKNWKLYFPHAYRKTEGLLPGNNGKPGAEKYVPMELELYDLANDINERSNLAGQQPQLVKELEEMAAEMRRKLGDALTNQTGKENRLPGRVEQQNDLL